MEGDGGGGDGDGGDGDGHGSPMSKSVSDSFFAALDPLFNVSDALATFKNCFQELQNHLRSIDADLDSLSETNSTTELEQLCASTCSRGLRKYIASHLSSESTLRRSVPGALRKFAPDPAKLVLDCVGGFYLQGTRAFSYASPLIPGRRAAILALEFFLLSRELVSDSVISPSSDSSTVTKEAESAAIAWRKRMIAEGGISKASMLDARGLFLFICCFGIPSAFKADDVIQLIRASNWRDIVDALRRSPYILPKIPGLLEEMARKHLGVEAVDLTFGFGMEDKITPQTILTLSLKEAKDFSSGTRTKEVKSSLAFTKKSYERHLTALKSAMRCLKEHNLDPDKVLPGWQVSDMIAKLEKDVTEISGKIQRRGQPANKGGSSRISTAPGIKRKRPKSEVAASLSHKLTGFQGPKQSPRMGNQKSADNGSFLARSFDNKHLGHGTSSLFYGSAPGLLAKAHAYPAAGTLGGVGIISSGIGISPAASHPLESLVEGMAPRVGIIDPTYGQHLYREPAYPGQLEQRYPNVSGVGGLHRPSLEGFPGLPTHLSNAPGLNDGGKPDPYRFADGI